MSSSYKVTKEFRTVTSLSLAGGQTFPSGLLGVILWRKPIVFQMFFTSGELLQYCTVVLTTTARG